MGVTPTMIAGARDDVKILQTRRTVDVLPEILLLGADDLTSYEPERYPMIWFMQHLAHEEAKDSKFLVFTSSVPPAWTTINHAAGYSASDTEIELANANYVTADYQAMFPRTGEHVLITALASNGTTATISRKFGTTAAKKLVHGDRVFILGSNKEDGAEAGSAISPKVEETFNYTEEISYVMDETWRESNSVRLGKFGRKAQQKIGFIGHCEQLERKLVFGEPILVTSGTHPRYATGGLNYFQTANIYEPKDGIITRPGFNGWLRQISSYGGGKKRLFFCSGRIFDAVEDIAWQKLRVNEKLKKIGLDAYDYKGGGLTITLITHPMLADCEEFEGMGFIVAMEQFALKIHGNNCLLRTDIQARKEHKHTDEYVSTVGFRPGLNQYGGKIMGVKA